MPPILHDAHRHQAYDGGGGEAQIVVNGTAPADWGAVIETARQHPQVIPAIGLHPWQVGEAAEDWRARFLEALPETRAVGEIGLDGWIEGCDMERQSAAFRWQLAQAAERNLPVSIHCLKAGDALIHIFKEGRLPKRGIHLHAYSGSAEQVAQFAEFGAYFSFHAGQFKRGAKKAPAAARAVPLERLLIETDAPDALDGTAEAGDFLSQGYAVVAELRGITRDELAGHVAANFQRYFLDD